MLCHQGVTAERTDGSGEEVGTLAAVLVVASGLAIGTMLVLCIHYGCQEIAEETADGATGKDKAQINGETPRPSRKVRPVIEDGAESMIVCSVTFTRTSGEHSHRLIPLVRSANKK